MQGVGRVLEAFAQESRAMISDGAWPASGLGEAVLQSLGLLNAGMQTELDTEASGP